MNKTLYLACPMNVSDSYLIKVIKYLENIIGEGNVTYWDRSSPYSPKLVEKASALVFLTVGNQFTLDVNRLPRGTKSEILKAYEAKIPVYGIYKPMKVDSPSIYEITKSENIMQYNAGTTTRVRRKLRELFKSTICSTLNWWYS